MRSDSCSVGILWTRDRNRHESLFTAKILELPQPTNAAGLRQFIASCNWVRGKLPRYAQLMEPLQTLLPAAMSKAKIRKSRAAARVPLTEWSAMHEETYENVKRAIVEAVKLAHPKPDYVMCLFTDASADHWSGMLTQVPREHYQATTDVQRWPHEPLSGLWEARSAVAPVIGLYPTKRATQFASHVQNLRTCLYATAGL